jgi:putative addiction module antidote
MLALKITKIGNSLGLPLPKEALAKLRVEQGDTVYLTETPDGFRLTADDPAFRRQMPLARKVMKNTVARCASSRSDGEALRWLGDAVVSLPTTSSSLKGAPF